MDASGLRCQNYVGLPNVACSYASNQITVESVGSGSTQQKVSFRVVGLVNPVVELSD